MPRKPVLPICDSKGVSAESDGNLSERRELAREKLEVDRNLALRDGLLVRHELLQIARHEYKQWKDKQQTTWDADDSRQSHGVDSPHMAWFWGGSFESLVQSREQESFDKKRQLKRKMLDAWDWWWEQEMQKVASGCRPRRRGER